MELVNQILLASWSLVVEAAPYLLVGFAIAGVMKALLPDETVVKVLGAKGTSSVVKASLIGAPLPLCSCGVVPVVQSIHKQGASRGASISFLVSTPETGADSVAMTYAMMGWPLAVIRPVVAIVTAFLAGMLENRFGSKDDIKEQSSCCARKNGTTESKDVDSVQVPNIIQKLLEGWKYAYVDLMKDISKNLLIGFFLGGLISSFIDVHFLEKYFSGSLLGMVGMVIFAIPLYICAAASTPVAAVFMMKGMSAGTALVFLMAGPATNIASLSVLSHIFGKRSIALYLLVIIFCSVGFGFLTDWLISTFNLPVTGIGHHHEHSPGMISYVCAIILLLCIIFHTSKHYLFRFVR